MSAFAETSGVITPRSRAVFGLDTRDGYQIEPTTGKLVARTGHRVTWSRGSSTLASVIANGGTYTAPFTLPAWEQRTIASVPTLAWRQDVNDILTAPLTMAPIVHSGRLTFFELGALATAGATLFAITGDDPTTGVRFYIDSSGSFYRITYHNGTTSVTATLTSGAPTSGQLVELRWWWASDGTLTLSQSINGGTATTAVSSALALPSAFATGAKIRIGRRGLTQNPAALSFVELLMLPGTLTDAAFLEAW